MANGTGSFDQALRRFDRPVRVDGLVRALGLEPLHSRPDPDGLPGLLPAGLDVVEARTAAERDGLLVLLLVLARPVRAGTLAEIGSRLSHRDPTRQYLLILCTPGVESLTLAAAGRDGGICHLTLDPRRPRPSDLETLAEMVAGKGEGGSALALRYARALDRSRVTSRFFRDFRVQREQVARGWLGVVESARADRAALALLFLCRLLFLYFLQRRGHLAGDPDFLAGRWRRWQRRPAAKATFFGNVLVPLFFGVLNTRPAERSPEARRFGALPYLNGGLFERTGRERALPALDLPDRVVTGVFDDLFERYRFTTVEPSDRARLGVAAPGIDPAMLGRVFEGLMAPGERGRTGTFFTPPRVVDDLVDACVSTLVEVRSGAGRSDPADCDRERAFAAPGAAGLHALHGIRVLDPACGSGAFLLGALARLAALRQALGEDESRARAHIVEHGLYGVDLQSDAALLCALRLWLALTLPGAPRHAETAPLPNLDRRIRQGDALLDPLDLSLPGLSAVPALRMRLRRHAAELAPVALRYLRSEPGEREAIQHELRARETAIARLWVEGWSSGLAQERRVLERRCAQRDLWGEPTLDARAAQDALGRLAEQAREAERLAAVLDGQGSLPFFSFPVHFPEAALDGFDLILTNPPWIRPHRWPAALRGHACRRYAVCREPGWSSPALPRTPGGSQTDLAMLFLERTVGLLAPDGVLGALLPAKMIRSLYAGPARRMLLRRSRIARIDDFSLDQRALFEADAFAMTLVAVRGDDAGTTADGCPGTAGRQVRIRMHRPGRETLRFDMAPGELPLVEGDAASPWLLAPRPVRRVLRRMQACGTPLGAVDGTCISRGLETGANDVLVVREVVPRLGGLARIRADGAFRARTRTVRAADFEATIEDAALEPLIRGADLRAWTVDARHYVIRNSAGSHEKWPRLGRYLDRHRGRLRREARPRPGGGRLPGGYRVAWHDLSDTLRAVAIPPLIRTVFGDLRRPVLLNTVYQVRVPDEKRALRIAAFLNSTPIRIFAAAIAERAKDAHFRFFAWTVSLLPIPPALPDTRDARSLERIAGDAHDAMHISAEDQARLDSIVVRAFGLTPAENAALLRFGDWLHGRAP